jgi:pimeloyl-ACP methyl ester carboxylesterase
LKALAERVRREAMVGRLVYGMHTRESFRPNDKERPTVLLVHGMNSASSCFVHMVPLLEEAGFGVILYDYPDNQDVDVSAPQFVKDWKALRKQTGDAQCWAIVGHSMGALLARYYVEGDDYANDVSQLILIAPPNEGSALAKAQGVFQLLQKMQGPQGESLGTLVELSEGLGEAADDMVPGAAFLKRLNARPRRSGVAYHILAGDAGFLTQTGRQKLEAQLRTATRAVGVFGKLARLATPNLDAVLDELTDGTGDGAVSVRSTRLDSVTDHVTIHSNHVELIRGPMLYPDPGPVVCMPYLLRWLKP